MVKLVIQINTSTDGIDKTCLVDLYANISISDTVLNVCKYSVVGKPAEVSSYEMKV